MTSVTNRIKVVKQPRGGYIPLKQFSAITLDDGKILNSDESVSPGLVGSAVDYLSRLMNGAHPKEAFKISLNGAYLVGEFDKAISLLDQIVGLDNQSIAAACILVGYDVALEQALLVLSQLILYTLMKPRLIIFVSWYSEVYTSLKSMGQSL